MATAQQSEGHRVYLRDLIRKEQMRSYRRHDYLSRDWQTALWKNEVQQQQLASSSQLSSSSSLEEESLPDARRSPSSVIVTSLELSHNSPSSLSSGASEVCPSNISETPLQPPSSASGICIRWREKITDWKYQVVDQFDLSREIVSISTFYLDRYLSIHYVDEELFQLVAMASIYLAIKIHSPKKVTIQSIATTASNGSITVQHIEAMELSIMKCLNWHLFPPTAVSFIENFFPLICTALSSSSSGRDSSNNNNYICSNTNQEDDIQRAISNSLELSRFLAELSVCAYPFVLAKPSSIAIAAILYSFEHFHVPHDIRETFTSMCARGISSSRGLDVNAPEVMSCRRLLHRVYLLAMPQQD